VPFSLYSLLYKCIIHLTDGLGSVRGMVNAMSDVLSTTTYSPYGVPDSPILGFAFTGEQRDTNGLQYHRARYYNAGLGTWASLDPFEGIHNRPMSLNGYSWVEGNVVNGVDPSGFSTEEPLPTDFAECVHDFFGDCSNVCSGTGIVYNWCLGHCMFHSREEIVISILSDLQDVVANNDGIDAFYLLSNTVAKLVDDDLTNYLFVMNSLLLGLKSSGTANVSLSLAFKQWPGNQNYRTDPLVYIGDTGIHCDYRDGEGQQISWHIWAYTAAAASSPLIRITTAGVFWHDNPVPHLANGTIQDRLAGIVGAFLGQYLLYRWVRPSEFGTIFWATFQHGFCEVFPNDSACVNYTKSNEGHRYFYQYMEKKEVWENTVDAPGCR
jgi:RHS repeat-associated protein